MISDRVFALTLSASELLTFMSAGLPTIHSQLCNVSAPDITSFIFRRSMSMLKFTTFIAAVTRSRTSILVGHASRPDASLVPMPGFILISQPKCRYAYFAYRWFGRLASAVISHDELHLFHSQWISTSPIFVSSHWPFYIATTDKRFTAIYFVRWRGRLHSESMRDKWHFHNARCAYREDDYLRHEFGFADISFTIEYSLRNRDALMALRQIKRLNKWRENIYLNDAIHVASQKHDWQYAMQAHLNRPKRASQKSSE